MQNQWIEVNPHVMMGKPVFRGTRIPVDLVLKKLAAGQTLDQILRAHPRLTREAVLAGLEFAAEVVGGETVYALPGSKE